MQRLHTDSAPEKSGLHCRPKDAEGVRLFLRVNLSGKRTEVKALGGFCFLRGVFVFQRLRFFVALLGAGGFLWNG